MRSNLREQSSPRSNHQATLEKIQLSTVQRISEPRQSNLHQQGNTHQQGANSKQHLRIFSCPCSENFRTKKEQSASTMKQSSTRSNTREYVPVNCADNLRSKKEQSTSRNQSSTCYCQVCRESQNQEGAICINNEAIINMLLSIVQRISEPRRRSLHQGSTQADLTNTPPIEASNHKPMQVMRSIM